MTLYKPVFYPPAAYTHNQLIYLMTIRHSVSDST